MRKHIRDARKQRVAPIRLWFILTNSAILETG